MSQHATGEPHGRPRRLAEPQLLLDAPSSEPLERVARLACRLLGVPVSFLSLIEEDRQVLLGWAAAGEPPASLCQVPVAQALSERLASSPGAIVVNDAQLDQRVPADPAIAAGALRSWAGMPVRLAGEYVGALWAADSAPRDWSTEDLAALEDLAAVAAGELELRDAGLERNQAQAALLDSEERIRVAFEAAPVGMVVVSLDPANPGRFLRVNQAFCDFVGRTQASLLETHAAAITHPGDVGLTEESLTAMASGELPMLTRLEKRYLHAAGHAVWGAFTASTVIPRDGTAPYAISLVEDVTERKRAELDLPAIANVLRRILSGADAREAIVQAAVDIAGASSAHLAEPSGTEKLTVTASAGLNLLGVEISLDAPSATASAYLRGEPMFLADPGEDALVSRELLELSGARSLMWQPIFSHEGVIGVLCVCWAERISDISARAARAVALLTVETAVALAHHEALERLAVQATTDPLTDLPNRRAWEERLVRELEQAKRLEGPITLALLDMDRFKHFNDTFGHAAGDDLLREFAQRARVMLRDGDTLARWGGEEFGILLPDCRSESQVEAILDRVRGAVPGGQTCSVGYGTWDGVESAEALVKRADRALYRAKALGRDRLVSAESQTKPS